MQYLWWGLVGIGLSVVTYHIIVAQLDKNFFIKCPECDTAGMKGWCRDGALMGFTCENGHDFQIAHTDDDDVKNLSKTPQFGQVSFAPADDVIYGQ